ncbi:polysaccharide biosynthesis protein [Synechococcus sp. MIT S9451]|uniref:polysaccharide biosynthesis protein n=1 Tax=Synechococcus sp. MIT S9451 TaxID=3082543 RepID=UPI0039B37CAA
MFFPSLGRYIIRSLIDLGPLQRRFLLIGIDSILLPASVWLSAWLRLAHPLHPGFTPVATWLLPASVLVGIPLYALSGQYKGLTRYVGSSAFYRLAGRNSLLVLLLVGLGVLLRLPMPPRSSWLLLWLLLTGFTGAIRFAMRDVLLSLCSIRYSRQLRVAIYGAGEAGAQLAAALRLAGNHQITVFLDDDPHLWNRSINGIPIKPPQILPDLVDEIDQVLLAIPSLTRSRRRSLVDHLQLQSIPVLQIPSVDDLTSGRARIDSLRPLAIEDLLGRDSVAPDPNLLGPFITGSVLCVTGAGGSIGSELCRQILLYNPSKLILIERSESSLYTIDSELRPLLSSGTTLIPVLGNVCDINFLKSIFSQNNVDIVFHAAAYKHVPLVQVNPISGIFNNVFSTRAICLACSSLGVRQVVLISTDKAVRPTNVMGASKRLAELIVQASSEEAFSQSTPLKQQTIFAMVRFGNVLGSSGSVVPLFRRQIASGGPITLTHPEIIRYFMTIPEAAQLVLQTPPMAQGGDVFLLDMGQPVRIKDLAEQMIKLSGLTLRDSRNPNGDIEIICTGIRPGEKLYEELLIDAKSEPTCHPLIFRAKERSISPQLLWQKLDSLYSSLSDYDVSKSLQILSELVPEWTPNSP